MKKLRPVMFVGTGSDVGKSVVNTGFCRLFLQDGYTPAPFKAQNMSLNSYVTPDGLEIGIAQAAQAEACGIACTVEMNPILLKPTSHSKSQLVLNGKPQGNATAAEYFNHTDRDMLFANAMNAFATLQSKYNPIVIEGAGSISEMNLWNKDIVNMRVAAHVQAATYLVADIDKGGVFASVYGSVKLLPPHHQDLIKGIIINKFRGDLSLFEEGKTIIKNITGKPVVGVIPYYDNIYIEPEDSVCLKEKNNRMETGKVNIAVVRLPHMSNFSDFDMLEQMADINLFYTENADELNAADIVIIPGTKNTLSDLAFIQQKGIATALQARHRENKPIYGICGGYQMMGEQISDPQSVEGNIQKLDGLGILPVKTTILTDKKTRQCEFTFLDEKDICKGYEIHMGQTTSLYARPVCTLANGENDGYFVNRNTWGSYIHGIFNNHSVIKSILQQMRTQPQPYLNHQARKEESYNKLADLIRSSVDVDYIYKSMQL